MPPSIRYSPNNLSDVVVSYLCSEGESPICPRNSRLRLDPTALRHTNLCLFGSHHELHDYMITPAHLVRLDRCLALPLNFRRVGLTEAESVES